MVVKIKHPHPNPHLILCSKSLDAPLLTSFKTQGYVHQSYSNKLLMNKCSFLMHFQLVSPRFVIQLGLSNEFLSFLKQKNFMSL